MVHLHTSFTSTQHHEHGIVGHILSVDGGAEENTGNDQLLGDDS